jgi:hypothetical protein
MLMSEYIDSSFDRCFWIFIVLMENVMIIHRPDFEAGVRDFKERLKNYEKVLQ